MPNTLPALLAPVVLLAAVPAAPALPPEGASGEMAFVDAVAHGLRKYRAEKDPMKRLAWLQELAATGDPRVAVALVGAADNENGDDLDCEAADVLWWYYASPDAASRRGLVSHDVIKPPPGKGFRPWWTANEADVRRRARQLR